MPSLQPLSSFQEQLGVLLCMALSGLIFHSFLWKKGFLQLPSGGGKKTTLPLPSLLFAFGIYLGTPLLIEFLSRWIIDSIQIAHGEGFSAFLPDTHLLEWRTWRLLLASIFNLYFLVVFSRKQVKEGSLALWKKGPSQIFRDFLTGIGMWVASFPLIVISSQLTEMFISYAFGFKPYEQVAIKYLKSASHSVPMLTTALLTIVLVAPILEEILFRGFFQTWTKRYVGPKAAILLSALCFALFHFSPSQGIGNLPIGISLFVLACYLGFLYEKRGSLFASIGLHVTFNAISTLRILFHSAG